MSPCRLAWALLAALLLFVATALRAQDDLQPIPALNSHVIDETGTLSTADRAALESKLQAFEGTTGSQMVIVIVPTTKPEDIADYTQRLGDAWKIGRRDVGDGLLIVVAKNDRRVRIAPAKALEGAVPDLAARQIIDNAITPAFRAGDFAGGLSRAVDEVSARVRGEALPPPKPRASRDARQGLQLDELAMFFFIGVPVLGALLTGLFGRKLGALATGGAAGALGWWLSASLLLAGAAGLVALILVGILGIGAARRGGFGLPVGGPVIWGGGGGRGWGGGGGGGGFSSGGGGDFGGGGASGNW
jgi:uncharacterized protein